MPRNADVMAVCDIAEGVMLRSEPVVTLREPAVTLRTCPVCAARRAADAARAQRHRAKRLVEAE
jgi:hypothetical protein